MLLHSLMLDMKELAFGLRIMRNKFKLTIIFIFCCADIQLIKMEAPLNSS